MSTSLFFTKRNSAFIQTFFAAVLLIFLFTNAVLQNIPIKGKVTNEKGEPVVAASVTIKGSKTGAQTNASGEFSLSIKELPVTITVSAVGFEKVTKTITKKETGKSIAIILKPTAATLDEVVVVGYEVRKKKEMAGAVSSVRSADIKDRSPISTSDAVFDKSSSTAFASPAYDAPLAEMKIRGAASGLVAEDAISSHTETTFKVEKKNIKKSGLLTAGEVNDFKKWTMWEDYNETAFKTHSERWGLYATQRYSVQLQNKNFKAVVGQKVYLVNRISGDTLWTAVSDNTGKAELWNGFTTATKEKDLMIAVQKEKELFPAIPFMQGVNRIVIDRDCKVSNKVEIAFVVDATGSMGDEIFYLKEELEDILTKIADKDRSLDLHTASVFYRDNADVYLTRKQAFSPGIMNTVNFIKDQNADGGGDYPEAVEEGLKESINSLEWSSDARTKIIFLFMDAPPHDAAKNEMAKLIMDAAKKGIRIVPVACSGTDKATEFIMRSMALATNGTYLFLTDDSGIGDGHIKPTTDEFKVELLNDLLQRIIEQMCYVNSCSEKIVAKEPLTIFTNTEKVKVFPNPTNGPVTLQTTKELKEIFVTDFTGKILMHKEVASTKGNYSIDLSGFPSATYLIRYVTKEDKVGAEKVVLIR